ncbi:MAG: transglycosylase SLT domain-containing protein [Burkholderiales bacterium]|nr:transglycosylase SLT domain-containing protein [Burkholderiales bacterium]
MIRLKIVSGSRRGATVSFGREPVRVGRSASAELRFAGAQDATVSTHHAQIVFERGAYFLVDTGSKNGTLVNGRKITGKHELRSGDRVGFGFPGGPEAEVEIDAAEPAAVPGATATDAEADTVALAPRASQPVYDARQDALRMAAALNNGAQDTSAIRVANEAARKVAERRARVGGERSGDTVFLLAEAMNQVTEVVRSRTRRKWVRVVAGLGGVALLVIGVLGGVVFYQQREIDRLVSAKTGIDRQIQSLQERMRTETDAASLAALEDNLVALAGSAQTTLEELQRKDKARAAQLAAGGDELDREIRKILVKFNASTYAIPPIFRERLQFHIDELATAGNRRLMFGRKQRYWPVITREFGALGLPEEMAHIAWVESGFDPGAQSPAGATGLWQMTTTTAQSLGLTVNGTVDERLDPEKQTKAAATYLARLLSEFGEDSFMLVLASYNRGENGVRRALGQVAREPGGFRKDKRDFWHLYRLKLLPEETREYVPRVLAAAIVAGNAQKYGLVN